MRISIEAKAILSIMKMCKNNEHILLGSDVLDIELSKAPDLHKRSNAYGLYEIHTEYVKLNDNIYSRAKEFERLGITSFDALHVAYAEFAKADIFLTTDDRLIKLAKTQTNMQIKNPAIWIMEANDE